MRVLWFTNTPSLATNYFDDNSVGGGWISSLESAFHRYSDYQLAIAFFTKKRRNSVVIGNTLYFPILRKSTFIVKFIHRHLSIVSERKYIKKYKKIIEEFNPDVIHIFGTENGFSYISRITDTPVCIHIQGIISDIQRYYIPPYLTTFDLLRYSSFKSVLLGFSFFHLYQNLRRRAVRELSLMSTCRYYLGRTDYDKSFILKHAPLSLYFHCDELLRDDFYFSPAWNYSVREKLVLITVNSGELYKGLDILLESARLLTSVGLNFEWRIVGIDSNNPTLKLFENEKHYNHTLLNIKLLGKLNSIEILQHMYDSQLFIHPSRIDNSPNSVCEAMMVGMPVIAFNVGGMSSMLNDDCGFLINLVDEKLLVDKILEIYSQHERLSYIGSQARRTAFARHNPAKVVDNLQHIYRKMISYG